jgi:four helix bundle protein
LSRILREKGMHNPKSSSVLEHSLAAVELARPVVQAVQRRDRDLASQLRLATSSVALNLAEGFGCTDGNARLRFETARGSLNEARTAIRVAVAWGYVSAGATTGVLECIDALGARVFGLARR